MVFERILQHNITSLLVCFIIKDVPNKHMHEYSLYKCKKRYSYIPIKKSIYTIVV